MKKYSTLSKAPVLLESRSQIVYPGHSLEEGSYPSAKMQLVYSTAPADWANKKIDGYAQCLQKWYKETLSVVKRKEKRLVWIEDFVDISTPDVSTPDLEKYQYYILRNINTRSWEIPKKRSNKDYTRMLRAILNNTPQSTNYTGTCLPSRKLYKLDEPGTQDTAGGAGTSS